MSDDQKMRITVLSLYYGGLLHALREGRVTDAIESLELAQESLNKEIVQDRQTQE